MTNQKKTCLAIICMILGCSMFASCGEKNKTTKEETEVVFSEAIIPIKMVIPGNWSTSRYKDDWIISRYTDDNLKIITSPSITFDNSLKENLNGANGLRMTLKHPCYIGNKDVKSIIQNIETTQKQKCGNNDVYISVPPLIGYIYFDGKYVMHIYIEHWPKNGMTPEMESFFSSLHID